MSSLLKITAFLEYIPHQINDGCGVSSAPRLKKKKPANSKGSCSKSSSTDNTKKSSPEEPRKPPTSKNVRHFQDKATTRPFKAKIYLKRLKDTVDEMSENTNKKSKKVLLDLVGGFWEDSKWLGDHARRLDDKEIKKYQEAYYRFVDLFENPHVMGLIPRELMPSEAKKFLRQAAPKSSKGKEPRPNHN